ncbi:hypothetical protein [Nostoc linckia]|nr:hypothetical protein [Nostoc linckia]
MTLATADGAAVLPLFIIDPGATRFCEVG